MKIVDGVLTEIYDEDVVDGKVIVPEGVTVIGETGKSTFASISAHKNTPIKVILPKSVRTIAVKAFHNASNLEEIEIQEGLETIESEAFGGCSSLKSITLKKGVKTLEDRIFYNCINLKEIKLNDDLERIGIGAFQYCISLKEITIPKEVISLENYLFAGCNYIEKINILGDVTYVGFRTFIDCVNLKSIRLPDTIKTINGATFQNCRSLETINIPLGVKEIPSEFAMKSGLKSVIIPEGVKRIGSEAFYNCVDLNYVKIPSTLEEISNGVFDGIDRLEIDTTDKVKALVRSSMLYSVPVSENAFWGKDVDSVKQIKKYLFKTINTEEFMGGINVYSQRFSREMNTILYKTIGSIGLDETLKLIKIPNLTDKELRNISSRLIDKYSKLYDSKNEISGSLRGTIDILKIFSQISSGKIKNSDELKVLKYINQKLENGYSDSLEKLLLLARNDGIEISDEIIKKISNAERSINKRNIIDITEKYDKDIKELISRTSERYHTPIVQFQIEPIANMVEDSMLKLYRDIGKISVEDFKRELNYRLEYSSPYIRQNKSQIIDNVVRIFENQDFINDINNNCLNQLRNTKNSIGGAWIYKINQGFKNIGYSINSIPEVLTDEEVDKLKEFLGIDIDVKKTLVFKEGRDKEEAIKSLIYDEFVSRTFKIVTYKMLHDIFGASQGYSSKEFKEFFKKHKDELLFNPKYISEVARICNYFDEIINSPELKNIYAEGKLTIDQIVNYLSTKTYSNQREGEEELARLSRTVGKISNEKEYARVQQIFDITKRRERTTIPPISVSQGKFRGRMLAPDDVLNLFAGNITTCCQKFGDVGEGAMVLGSIEENGGIFVVEELDEKGNPINIIGQSLTIRQKGKYGDYDRLAFDNIEITNSVKEELSSEDKKTILEIYKQAGKQAMEKDRKFLGRLLAKKLISQEQYDSLILKEVTAGTGYNDLEGLYGLRCTRPVVPDEAYHDYIIGGLPWIDSTEGRAPRGSQGYSVILADIDFDEQDKFLKQKEEGKVPESNPKDVPLWYGKVGEVKTFTTDTLTQKDLETLKQIEKQVYREEQQVISDADSPEIMEYYFEINNMKVKIGSNNDWYMVYGEDRETIDIADLAVIGGINSSKGEEKRRKEGEEDVIKTTPDRKLAIAESADEMYSLLIYAVDNGKEVLANLTMDTSAINAVRMLRQGLISITTRDGTLILYDEEKGLVYDNGEKVQTRGFDDDEEYNEPYSEDENIDYDSDDEDVEYDSDNEERDSDDEEVQMLDVIIIPDREKLIEAKEKVSNLLSKVQDMSRMRGTKKEEGLDELRDKLIVHTQEDNTDLGEGDR